MKLKKLGTCMVVILSSSVGMSEFMYDNVSNKKVELGRLLFFDKVLSGNKNISCSTCHHPTAATGDNLSLPAGEGASGVAEARKTGKRVTGIRTRVPRNSPPVFNLGFSELNVLFHDGRVTDDSSFASGFKSPAGENLPEGLDNALAAQAMFPVTSNTEMAGGKNANKQGSMAAKQDHRGVWKVVANKVKAIPTYVSMMNQVYGINKNEITMVHIANAIAAFEGVAFRADNSPYDRFLAGESNALSSSQKRGMALFNGKAGCVSCHSGKFQTDNSFHAIAWPQIGPGKDNGIGKKEDFGREIVSKDSMDRYKFRTPTLRNVALTGPYGHNGAYSSLKSVVRHHLDPVNSLMNYDGSEAILPFRADLAAKDMQPSRNPQIKRRIAEASELHAVNLSISEVDDVVSFLHALTDPSSIDLTSTIPSSVPSGLPVKD